MSVDIPRLLPRDLAFSCDRAAREGKGWRRRRRDLRRDLTPVDMAAGQRRLRRLELEGVCGASAAAECRAARPLPSSGLLAGRCSVRGKRWHVDPLSQVCGRTSVHAHAWVRLRHSHSSRTSAPVGTGETAAAAAAALAAAAGASLATEVASAPAAAAAAAAAAAGSVHCTTLSRGRGATWMQSSRPRRCGSTALGALSGAGSSGPLSDAGGSSSNAGGDGSGEAENIGRGSLDAAPPQPPTRLVDLLTYARAKSRDFFRRRPMRRALFGGISLLLGFFVAQTISLSFGALSLNDVVAAAFCLVFTEAVTRVFHGTDKPSFSLALLNGFKMGFTYGLFIDAFKLAS